MKRISKQALWQQREIAAGRCPRCRQPLTDYRTCQDCVDKRRAASGVKTPRLPKLVWETCDWSQPNASIAREFGVTHAAVTYQRRKLTKP